jgi:DNA-binding GntR family transcriptional regulator
MQRQEIDAWWPIVVARRDDVLKMSEQRSDQCRTTRRINRADLLMMYSPGRKFAELAHHFGVSPGSVNEALSAFVGIARRLERQATLDRHANGKRCVVIIPVDHRAEAEYVLAMLAPHDIRGVVEHLDCGDIRSPADDSDPDQSTQ